jgi:release factor glutamine methyltransferase
MREMRVVPGLKAGDTLAAACELTARLFRAAGIESAKADARILAGHALGLDRAALLAQRDRLLEAREIDAISSRAARRLKREPVSRIVGYREFWNLRLAIDPAVLDPRPETETLVEAALDWVTQSGRRREKLRVLDIGTGSGALLLALLAELPNAVATGSDKSAAAVDVAMANADRLGFRARCSFVVCDIADALPGPFDLIVSNPPYISTGEIASLAPEVRNFDPHLALDGGEDGLEAYRAVARQSRRLLAPNGRLIVELGQGLEPMVASVLSGAGLNVAGPARNDLAGIARALAAEAS